LVLVFCIGAFSLYLLIDRQNADRGRPTITVPGEALELSVQDPKEAYLQGVTAFDDKDGDVTASLVVSSVRLVDTDGAIEVTYAAFDKAGNVTKAERQIKLTDYRSPRFDLNRSLTFSSTTGFNIFTIVTAEDVLDGDITHRVRAAALDPVDVYTPGVSSMELSVRNSLGETAKLVIPVEVYAAGTYQATLTLTDYMVYLPVGSKLDAENYLDTFSRTDMTMSLRDGIPEGYSLEVKSNVQADVPGVYTVDYWVTQTVGAESDARMFTGYSKLIVVVEG
jgi:hypothetical protein